ncbi:MAG TPA: nitroreductase family protein, partial [Anaerovoracaceae bacterium]|nr:nitroreductase family protein [Anaerovoracaceae bacterium]
MEAIFEVIEKRYSVRSYSGKEIEGEKLQKIRGCFDENKKGPFGSDVRFEIVDATDYEQDELKKFGTYGMIKGPRVFIAGAVRKNKTAMEDFGYCMEKIILMATSLGLGTCWLGGSLNRSTFADKINAGTDELIPAVTPVGYAADKRTLTENLVRMAVGAKNRKKPEELFFDVSVVTPLNPDSCGQYSKVLTAVRLAPSAGNKQPWRIIKDTENTWHLFMKENPAYNNAFKEIQMQEIDMGIAMCHFELAAAELGLEGVWEIKNPTLASGDLKYIVSWTAQ